MGHSQVEDRPLGAPRVSGPDLLVLSDLPRPHRHPCLRNNYLDHTESKDSQCNLMFVKVPTESNQMW